MIWSMKILMADLTKKDSLSKVILMCICFGAPSFGDHDDLIGPLGLLFVDMHHDYENVGKMGIIRCVDGYVFSGCFFRMVFCYFLPESLSKSLPF